MTDILAITNAEAGTAEQRAVDEAVRVMRGSQSLEVAGARDGSGLDQLLRGYAGVPTVVVLGGDGSLHAVVSGLHRLGMLADVRVGLVPMGTGNDFARSARLSTNPSEAAQQLLAAEPQKVDLLVDDAGGVVVNAVHLGLGAEAGAAARPWKKALGPVGYAVGATISGFTRPGLDLHVLVDGAPVKSRGKVLQVAIGNGPYVGGGAPLLPDADPTDGLLDVAVSYANPPLRRLAYAAQLRVGQHTRRDDVTLVRGTRVEVSGEPFRCNADGEIGSLVGGRTWWVDAGAVTMLLPRETG
ncbi:MAG: diacylglycerol/lipid kinase family protein [Nocardioidaceae bacterium]